MSVITVLMRLDPGKLELYRKNPDELFKHGAESIDIGKAGPGIVWLLSRIPAQGGSTEASLANQMLLPSLLEGKGALKEEGLDDPSIMGPPVSLTTREVNELAELLQSTDDEAMRLCYDPAAMTNEQIYPWIWREGGMDAFKYLLVNFEELRSFFSRASEAGQQVLIWWS